MKNHQNSRLIILFALFILTVVLSTCKKEKPLVEPPSPPKEGILFNPDLTYDSISDIDGNTYKTIQIGTQTWMAENLKTTKLNDGADILKVTDYKVKEANFQIPYYCWYDNDETKNKPLYGALYNNITVSTGRLCPVSWHVPSDLEWTMLINYLGGQSTAGVKLKEIDTLHWLNPNPRASNESGFTALPGGWVDGYNQFYLEGRVSGIWWAFSGNSVTYAYYRQIKNASGWVLREFEPTGFFGLSVRCAKDN